MALTKQEWVALENKAADLRSLCADTIFWAGSGHLGGSFSSADLLTILYYKYMNFDPKHYDDPDRDRMVVSKGHIGVILAPLFAQMGLIDPEDLKTFNLTGSKLGIHLDSNKVKGLDTSTGSLGHGSALALGLALAAELRAKITKPSSSSVTANATKAPSGKPLWQPQATTQPTSSPSLTATTT